MSHPIHELDDTVHQRVRLGILAVLSEADMVEFTFLRDRLAVTDGNLARHLQVLVDAGYARSEKEGSPARTWIHATRDGRAALEAHIQRLREITEGINT